MFEKCFHRGVCYTLWDAKLFQTQICVRGSQVPEGLCFSAQGIRGLQEGMVISMRIAVCDDEEIILRQTRELLERVAGEYFEDVEIECFTDNRRMLEEHEQNAFDIVVLDIQMGPLDGFQAAERLSGMEHHCKLIFLSSKEELVFQSFSYEPVYFVRKGSPERMGEEFRRSFQRIREKLSHDIFLSFTGEDDMIEKVFLTEIESIQSSRNYLLYYTTDGRVFRRRSTMEEEEKALRKYGFIRIHRAFLVNGSHVLQVKRGFRAVKLKSGTLLEIGRNYREQAQGKLL